MSFLRRTLLGNGVFSLIAGVGTTLFADGLSGLMDVPEAVLYVVGVGTAMFALAILTATRKTDVNLRFAVGVIVADLSWVVAAVVVLLIPASMAAGGKLVLGGISAVVGMFASLQVVGLVRATRETPKLLRATIEISAPPEQVWSVLADLDLWHLWNPWIHEATGTITPGEQLSLRMGMEDGRKFSVKPAVTAAEANRALEWLGHVGVEGLFDGRHRFVLESTDSGTTLVQTEEFTGLFVPMLEGMLDGDTLEGFEAMNQALKDRVEEVFAASGS